MQSFTKDHIQTLERQHSCKLEISGTFQQVVTNSIYKPVTFKNEETPHEDIPSFGKLFLDLLLLLSKTGRTFSISSQVSSRRSWENQKPSQETWRPRLMWDPRPDPGKRTGRWWGNWWNPEKARGLVIAADPCWYWPHPQWFWPLCPENVICWC